MQTTMLTFSGIKLTVEKEETKKKSRKIQVPQTQKKKIKIQNTKEQ